MNLDKYGKQKLDGHLVMTKRVGSHDLVEIVEDRFGKEDGKPVDPHVETISLAEYEKQLARAEQIVTQYKVVIEDVKAKLAEPDPDPEESSSDVDE